MTLFQNAVRLFLIAMASVCLLVDTSFAQPGGRLSERLRELDKDNDGKLSIQEFGRDEATFNTIDRNDDAHIDLPEIRAFLKAGGKLRQTTEAAAEPAEFLGAFSVNMPVSLKTCRLAADYSREANGHAVLVMFDGKIVYEKYDNGWSRQRAHRLASGTKSFAGVAAALAVGDGLFQFDDCVSETITEWQGDDQLSKVTIRQLLSLTSGIDPGDNSVVLPYAKAIDAKAKHEPGTKFEYGPNPFQIFGELMRRKLANKKQTFLDYLRERVFEPIGLEAGPWRSTNEGYPHVPSGAFITARNWSKLGELLRCCGDWEGKRILREDLLVELTQGTNANAGYGMTFWLDDSDGANGEADLALRTTTPSVQDVDVGDLFMAAGAGKQRLYIIPNRKLVVVRFGESRGRRFQDDAFLKRLIKSPSKRGDLKNPPRTDQ